MTGAAPGGAFDRVSTARLRLERPGNDSFAEIRRMHQDADTMAELGGVQTVEQSREYLDRNLAHWDRHGHGLWIVYEAGGTEPVGRAVLRHVTVEGRDEVEVGYALYPPFRRRGYGTEITEACVAIGFDRLGLGSVIALTTATNAASHGVLAKCGFALEGPVRVDHTDLVLFRRLRPTASAPAP